MNWSPQLVRKLRGATNALAKVLNVTEAHHRISNFHKASDI